MLSRAFRMTVLLVVLAVFLVGTMALSGEDRFVEPTRSETVIFTGGTSAYLDPCGCSDGQFGGVTRRTPVMGDVFRKNPHSFLVDAGGFFDGTLPFDRLRSATNLEAMQLMGYRLANLTASEFNFGRDFLEEKIRGSENMYFISSDLRSAMGEAVPWFPLASTGNEPGSAIFMGFSDMTQDHAAELGLEVRPWRVVIPELMQQVEQRMAGVLMVLSALPREENEAMAREFPRIGLIIQKEETEKAWEVGKTHLVSCPAKGKYVGEAILTVTPSGRVKEFQVRRLPVHEAGEEDPELRRLVRRFYHRVEKTPSLQQVGGMSERAEPLFPDPRTEGNGYLGSKACGPCHQDQYRQWESTRHSHAYDTLLQRNRQFLPACLSCHVVGLGQAPGSMPGNLEESYRGVGCENCHGPGDAHTHAPSKENIRREVPREHCAKCHTEEQHPEFDHAYPHMAELVDHTQVVGDGLRRENAVLATIRNELMVGAEDGVVYVDMFVMSMCPYGTAAENDVIPMMRKLGDKARLRLHFIAGSRETGGEKKVQTEEVAGLTALNQGCQAVDDYRPDTRFHSLHGQAEVDEDIRQAVLMKFYPEKFLDYVLRRNKDILADGDWKDALKSLRINHEIIQEIVNRDGDRIFEDNIRLSYELSIVASPTIFVNGELVEHTGKVDIIGLGNRVCSPDNRPVLGTCDRLPACAEDRHCFQPGKVGVCLDPGTPSARCEYRDPFPFKVYAVSPDNCPTCTTDVPLQVIMHRFPGVRTEIVSAGSGRGRELIELAGVRELPLYVFDRDVENTARFLKFRQSFQDLDGDHYLLDPQRAPRAYNLDGPYPLVSPTGLDFGEVAPGRIVERDVSVRNGSTGRLLVHKATALDEAVKVRVRGADGGPYTVEVELDTTGMEDGGEYGSTVFLHTNDPLNPYVPLKLRADVWEPIVEVSSTASREPAVFFVGDSSPEMRELRSMPGFEHLMEGEESLGFYDVNKPGAFATYQEYMAAYGVNRFEPIALFLRGKVFLGIEEIRELLGSHEHGPAPDQGKDGQEGHDHPGAGAAEERPEAPPVIQPPVPVPPAVPPLRMLLAAMIAGIVLTLLISRVLQRR